LFDGAGFARDIEALYRRMWARAAAGLPPEHLAAG
jgi:predicted O-linked N-acetylglucosamine transferase (SPINDLY family)